MLIAIFDFSLLLPVKLSLLIPFAPSLVSVLCFFFDGSLAKVIALPTIAIAIVVALANAFKIIKERQLAIAIAIVGRAITLVREPSKKKQRTKDPVPFVYADLTSQL